MGDTERLAIQGELIWDVRWSEFRWDMNSDGAVTISDLWQLFLWVLYAPRDALVLALMIWAPDVAEFLEFTPSSVGGVFSLAISIVAWFWVIWYVCAITWSFIRDIAQNGL